MTVQLSYKNNRIVLELQWLGQLVTRFTGESVEKVLARAGKSVPPIELVPCGTIPEPLEIHQASELVASLDDVKRFAPDDEPLFYQREAERLFELESGLV